jgi:hypothetical protein
MSTNSLDKKKRDGYDRVHAKDTNKEPWNYDILMGVPAETSAMAYHVTSLNLPTKHSFEAK